jgi:hypothetical protein
MTVTHFPSLSDACETALHFCSHDGGMGVGVANGPDP